MPATGSSTVVPQCARVQLSIRGVKAVCAECRCVFTITSLFGDMHTMVSDIHSDCRRLKTFSTMIVIVSIFLIFFHQTLALCDRKYFFLQDA